MPKRRMKNERVPPRTHPLCTEHPSVVRVRTEMDTSMYNQWVQSPIQESPPHDDRPAATTSPASASLDITDFGAMGDLPGDFSSAVDKKSPQTHEMRLFSLFRNFSGQGASALPPFYNPYGTYFMQSPYNTMAYGTSPWASSVPLSNYSSLNGATTSSQVQQQHQQSPQQQHAQPQQQQQQPLHQPVPSTSQQMMIEYVPCYLFSSYV